MNRDLDPLNFDDDRPQMGEPHWSANQDHPNQLWESEDELWSDHFDLLSAYLDNEATEDECKQVEEWLDNEPAVQKLYDQLLKLHQGFELMPVPPLIQPVEETIEAVFSRLDEKPKRPKLMLLWGGAGAIAAMLIAAISSVIDGGVPLVPRVAESPQPTVAPSTNPQQASVTPITMYLNKPLLTIPKQPVVEEPETGL